MSLAEILEKTVYLKPPKNPQTPFYIYTGRTDTEIALVHIKLPCNPTNNFFYFMDDQVVYVNVGSFDYKNDQFYFYKNGEIISVIKKLDENIMDDFYYLHYSEIIKVTVKLDIEMLKSNPKDLWYFDGNQLFMYTNDKKYTNKQSCKESNANYMYFSKDKLNFVYIKDKILSNTFNLTMAQKKYNKKNNCYYILMLNNNNHKIEKLFLEPKLIQNKCWFLLLNNNIIKLYIYGLNKLGFFHSNNKLNFLQ